jgi:cytoskeleton protein RodZ
MTDKNPTKDSRKGEQGGPEQVEAFDPLPGDLLRAARSGRGWTLARVAEEMNLEIRVIEAMEDNRFEELGAPVFARGHLRNYALLLGVDTDRLMDAYSVIEEERMPAPAATVEGLAMSGDDSSGRSGWRTILILLVIGALAVLGWRLLKSNRVATPTSVGAVAVESADRQSPLADGDEPVAVPLAVSVGGPEEDAMATGGPDSPGDSPERGVQDEPPPLARSEAVPVEVAEPPSTPVAGGANLRFEFLSDSWVEVRDGNGDRLVYQLGRAGAQRSVNGLPPFDIFLGFADGVAVEMNSQPVVVPSASRLGRTARFYLSPEEADLGDAR